MPAHRIEQSFIDEIIARIDIVNIIEGYIPLKKQGQNYSANCPFHQENTPSFIVNTQKQFFHCFGCKASGNAITFIMQHENVGFMDTLEKLASIAGMTIPTSINSDSSNTSKLYDITEIACAFYETQLRDNKALQAVDYLKQRNITGLTAKFFRIGYAPPGWRNLLDILTQKRYDSEHIEQTGLAKIQSEQKKYDLFRERIIFPIRNHRGKIVGFGGRVFNKKKSTNSNYSDPKYLNSPESTIFHKSKILYGLYEAIQSNKKLEQVIIVEGYLDVIQLHQHGIKNALATLGTATSKEHITLLCRYTKNFIFCFDGDPAGRLAAKKAMSICLSLLTDDMNIKFVFLPSGDDPDSIVNNKGIKEFQNILQNAIPIDQFFFRSISDTLNLAEAAHRSKLIAESIPTLSNIPGPAISHIMFGNLSKLVHVSIDELKSLKPHQLAQKTVVKPDIQKRSTLRLLTALLLQYPQLKQHITEKDFDAIHKYPNSEFLINLIEIIGQNPNIHTGGIVEKWRDHPDYSFVSKLAAWDTDIHTKYLEIEFKGLLDKLRYHLDEIKIRGLLDRLEEPETHDTLEEKRMVLNLIKQQKGL